MKTLNQEKIEYWRNHFEQSKQYPDGIQAYCRANKLATSAYYNWRQRILNLKPSKAIPKKVKSPFLPVVVSSDEVKIQSYPHQRVSHQLPDSRWVAEIITNVIRGLL
jgi:hypothetical protein